jgi:rhombotail lipoprotein
MKSVLILVLLLSIVGCARGFDRGALRDQLNHESPAQISNSDIQKALELKPQLSFPFRLAVYLQRDQAERRAYGDSLRSLNWRWEGEDKDNILSVAEKLRSEGVVSDMFIIPPARVAKDDLAGIRLAAAEHGADAVLVVNGITDVDRYNNFASFLYLTVVGMWVVPGTHADSLFVLDGAMWDVKNQYLYLSVESEGLASKTGPQMILKDRDSVSEAKKQALQSFGPELEKRLLAVSKTRKMS